jgi:hypothetical protein
MNDNIKDHPDQLEAINKTLSILESTKKIPKKKNKPYTTIDILNDMTTINNNEKLKSRRSDKSVKKSYTTLTKQDERIRSLESRLRILEKNYEKDNSIIVNKQYLIDSLKNDDDDDNSDTNDTEESSSIVDESIDNETIYAKVKKQDNGTYIIDKPFDITDQKNPKSLQLKRKIMKMPVFNKRSINTRNPTILKVVCDFVANRFCKLPKHNAKLREELSYHNITGKDVFMAGDLKNNAIQGNAVDYHSDAVPLTSALTKVANENYYHERFVDSIVEGNINKYERFLYDRVGYKSMPRGRNAIKLLNNVAENDE